MEGPFEPGTPVKHSFVLFVWPTRGTHPTVHVFCTTSHTTRTESQSTLDQTFDALCHLSRRRILSTLAQANPRDTDEFESADFKPDDEELEAFRVNLHHSHLPKLAEAEFINWNRETDTITRGPRFEEIRPLLKLMDDHQDELPENWP